MKIATYTVIKGDCLWTIAEKKLGSGLKWVDLANLNSISTKNPIIYPGQVLNLDIGNTSTPTTTSTTSSQATIQYFGLQAGTDTTVFATWSWDKDHTNNYRVIWYYDTGNGVWFVGEDSTTPQKQSIYSAPPHAKNVKFKVQPISTTHKVNDKDTHYWTASWSTEKTYNFSNNPPKTPPIPTVKIEKYKLTATLDNLDINATHVQFQVVRDNFSVFNTGTAKITTDSVSYSCSLASGSEYKVRARGFKEGDKVYGEWSDYSSGATTIPATPLGPTCKAMSETSVYITWANSTTATKYDIEYTTEQRYFDGSNETTMISGVESLHYEKTGLESGKEYFFRVRAVNNVGESSWTESKSIIIGKPPVPPTTWSSSTTVVTGESLMLYWVHNTEDGSSQTYAEVELIINGVKNTYTIKNTTNEDEKDKTSSYEVKTSTYIEGTKIQWRVRTAGVTKAYGDWSVQRLVDIYAPPTLSLNILTAKGTSFSVLESFPFYVSALAEPKTQRPVGYHLTITSNEVYETVDNVGNIKMVNKNEQVYSKYFDITDALLVQISAFNVNLENNIEYVVTCRVSMDSGLTADSSTEFKVAWTDKQYSPDAEIGVDMNTYTTYIRPYCEIPNQNGGNDPPGSVPYTIKVTEPALNIRNGPAIYFDVVDVIRDRGKYEIVAESAGSGSTKGWGKLSSGIGWISLDYVTRIDDAIGKLVEGVTLSIYRREFDGSFTELAVGLANTAYTFITDPHPSLDYARYRIVAITTSTGAVSYYDPPGYPIGEKSVIIQWAEEWTSFEASAGDTLEKPPWSGSLLRLPYNINVSDSYGLDVSLVEYIGRQHPVSYYGTQIGETASWSMDIRKDDEETLYALRRLARWMGDVYVREPSGSGYWANVSVSFSQTHRELTIPVTFAIKRVEGGM